jgi:hypothetical protein
MGRGVDSPRAAADDSDAEVGQLVAEATSDLDPVMGGLARAHEGDGVPVAGSQLPADIEDDRRIVDLAQQRRVILVGLDEDAAAELVDAAEFAGQVDGGFPGGDGFGGVLADAVDMEQLLARGAEDGRGVTEMVEEMADPHGST